MGMGNIMTGFGASLGSAFGGGSGFGFGASAPSMLNSFSLGTGNFGYSGLNNAAVSSLGSSNPMVYNWLGSGSNMSALNSMYYR